MKKIFILGLLLMSVSPTVFAFADDDVSYSILNNASVKAIAKLMIDKHGKSCTIPSSPDDIHWMCTGLTPPGPRPTVEMSGCAFYLSIKCANESADFYGRTIQYTFNDSNGSAVNTDEKMVVINNVQFKKH